MQILQEDKHRLGWSKTSTRHRTYCACTGNVRWERDFLYRMCDHQKPWQHHCSHTPLHEHTAHGGADEGEQCPAGLCPSLDDLPSVSPSDFHVAFEGWSIRSLLFSSFSLFHLNPPSASFFFYFSIPCISSISSTCSNFSEPCPLFLQHCLHLFRM